MVDLEARKRLAVIIRGYLNDEMTAFKFDEALDEFRWDQDDETVGEIAWELASYCDNLRDHLVVADKELWDYFHRLLLVLESQCEFEPVDLDGRSGRVKRFIACACLVAYCAGALWVGWNTESLWLLSVPFGVIAMALAFGIRGGSLNIPREAAIVPFTSVYQILQARRRVPNFAKQPYPKALADRRIRGWALGCALGGGYTVLYLCKLIAAMPFVVGWTLLQQSFKRQHLRVADPV